MDHLYIIDMIDNHRLILHWIPWNISMNSPLIIDCPIQTIIKKQNI